MWIFLDKLSQPLGSLFGSLAGVLASLPAKWLNVWAAIDWSGWRDWHLWVLGALLMGLLEMLTPGFVLACLAIGCLAAAITDLAGIHDLLPQIWVCSGATFLSFFLIRPFMLRTARGVQSNTGTDLMVGQDVVIAEEVLADGVAQAKVHGELWRVQRQDGNSLQPGDSVRIVGVDGNRLIVGDVPS